jgi:uncharacterized membrane protein
MEIFLTLLGLVVLAFPVIAIVALVKVLALGDGLRRLEARLARVERTAAAGGALPSPALDEPAAPVPARPAIAEHPAPASSGDEAAKAPSSAPLPRGHVPPPRQTISAPAGMTFEERLGTQWAVWVGGIALALGGVFLVRYSIEQGLLGPGVRVALGALFACALIAAGEWARRGERLSGIAGLPTAHIPGVLTAAGTIVAYADVYAAYALYDLLAPGIAFALLGMVALATLAAALLHGPALAGLGMLGAYLTPLLVAGRAPDYWALYVYLAIVTAAAFALARLRLWRWLAVAALASSLLWTFPGLARAETTALVPHVFHVVAGFILAALLLVAGFLYGPPARRDRIDGLSSGALAGYLAGAALVAVASRHQAPALAAFAALTAASVAVAWRAHAATAAVPLAALLAALVILRWAVDLDLVHLVAPSGPVAGTVPEPARAEVGGHLALGIGFAALFGAAGFLAQGRFERPVPPVLWSGSAVLAPLAILVALYWLLAKLEPSLPFAATALALAALSALATEALGKRDPRPGLAASGALFACGSVAALALALAMALERGWLTIGLALMVPSIAWVERRRPWPVLRVLAAALAVVVLARIAWEPRIVGSDVGTRPVFNWLLYGYGVPAAALWLGGRLLRRRADDAAARMLDAGALLLAVLTVFMEIRHYINEGDIYRPSAGLTEVALQVCVGLAVTIGLERLRLRSNSFVHDAGALLIASLTLIAILLGLGIGANPMRTGEPVGGRFINLILLGYGLPAVLAAALALISRGVRPSWYSAVAATTSVALALGYLSLQVRTLFHGEVLTRGVTGDAEQYAYSAVWLAFAVALLGIGLRLRSQTVRLASAAVVILTALKVFLVDMHDLTGVYQGLSFIGLGVVLLGIGFLYQRLLFPRRADPSIGAAPV